MFGEICVIPLDDVRSVPLKRQLQGGQNSKFSNGPVWLSLVVRKYLIKFFINSDAHGFLQSILKLVIILEVVMVIVKRILSMLNGKFALDDLEQ